VTAATSEKITITCSEIETEDIKEIVGSYIIDNKWLGLFGAPDKQFDFKKIYYATDDQITGSEEGGQHSLLPCQLIVTSTRNAGNDLCFLGTVPPGMAGYTSQYMWYYLWSDTIVLATLFTNKKFVLLCILKKTCWYPPRNVQATD